MPTKPGGPRKTLSQRHKSSVRKNNRAHAKARKRVGSLAANKAEKTGKVKAVTQAGLNRASGRVTSSTKTATRQVMQTRRAGTKALRAAGRSKAPGRKRTGTRPPHRTVRRIVGKK